MDLLHPCEITLADQEYLVLQKKIMFKLKTYAAGNIMHGCDPKSVRAKSFQQAQ